MLLPHISVNEFNLLSVFFKEISQGICLNYMTKIISYRWQLKDNLLVAFLPLIGQIDRNRSKQETKREGEMNMTCNKGQTGDIVVTWYAFLPLGLQRSVLKALFNYRKLLNWLQ